MQLRYVFSELGQGLRRNLSMHLAVILTLFVSLTLVGMGVLFHQQATKAAEQWGNQLQITVFLCRNSDSNPVCPNAVTDAQKTEIEQVVEDNPEVADYYFESSEEALEKARSSTARSCSRVTTRRSPPRTCRRRSGSPSRTPSSSRGSPAPCRGSTASPGSRTCARSSQPILGAISMLQWVALATAAVLVFAALLLVANTIRLAAFARRKEIGIMRLVGASTLYIALPFLLEALVTAVIGVVLAGGALAAFMQFGIEQRGERRR